MVVGQIEELRDQIDRSSKQHAAEVEQYDARAINPTFELMDDFYLHKLLERACIYDNIHSHP